MSIPDPGELFTIGQLAGRTGVPARTLRFWSDAGLVPPTARSASGYRLPALRRRGGRPARPGPGASRARPRARRRAGDRVPRHLPWPRSPRRTSPSSTASQLETFTDARVERYWQLLAIINAQQVPPSVVPVFDWLIAALRADLGS